MTCYDSQWADLRGWQNGGFCLWGSMAWRRALSFFPSVGLINVCFPQARQRGLIRIRLEFAYGGCRPKGTCRLFRGLTNTI